MIPQFEDTLGKNPQDLAINHLRQVKPTYDAKSGVLIGGRSMSMAIKEIYDPIFRLDGPLAVIGTQITAVEQPWFQGIRNILRALSYRKFVFRPISTKSIH